MVPTKRFHLRQERNVIWHEHAPREHCSIPQLYLCSFLLLLYIYCCHLLYSSFLLALIEKRFDDRAVSLQVWNEIWIFYSLGTWVKIYLPIENSHLFFCIKGLNIFPHLFAPFNNYPLSVFILFYEYICKLDLHSFQWPAEGNSFGYKIEPQLHRSLWEKRPYFSLDLWPQWRVSWWVYCPSCSF